MSSVASGALAGVAPDRTEGFLRSTVGRKVVMAASGVVLFGFVVMHLAGNLLVYAGPEALDAYGAFLRQALHGAAIWIARLVLLVAVVAHIWAAWVLTRTSWDARPVPYRRVTRRESTYASRTMRWSGPILALFVVYHLLHLTFGSAHPSFEPGRVYHNVVAGFSVWPVSLFYIVSMLALGLHLYHGVFSMFQSVGLSHPRYDPWRRAAAALFTAFVVIGNVSIPVAVLAGVVR